MQFEAKNFNLRDGELQDYLNFKHPLCERNKSKEAKDCTDAGQDVLGLECLWRTITAHHTKTPRKNQIGTKILPVIGTHNENPKKI